MLEQEERYNISESQIKKVLEVSTLYLERMEMLDISFYKNGENLYDLYKYIVRIRQKGDKKTLEIKNYVNEDSCLEGSINLDSIQDAIQFLSLMNLQPALYLKRNREVRKYKNLDIFIDRFDLIGNYVEIEYQNSVNAISEIEEFKQLCNINGEKQDMYGGIIQNKLANDPNFKQTYNERLNKIIDNL